MTRVPSVLAVSVLIAVATSGCAHRNGSTTQIETIRVVPSEQELAGCEKLAALRVVGAANRSEAQAELERLAQANGGNVLLLSESGDGTSGAAYRCSGTPAGATP